ncbi:MAG TPA: alpha/beta hydrolase [Hymenobacter sp.]|jgi:pimeloyl-ACP methyl ester carboxylesterase
MNTAATFNALTARVGARRWLHQIAVIVALLLSTPAFAAPAPFAPTSFKVEVTGQGQPMLLIPGLTCSGEVWQQTVAHYQGRYQCHVLTLAGFAGHPALPGGPTDHYLQTVRDEVIGYIKAQRLRKPTLVGHSLGGFTALWVSATTPELVGPVVIVDALPFIGAIMNPAATAESNRPQAEAQRQQMSQGRMPAAMQKQMLASLITSPAHIETAAAWGQASDPATTVQAMFEMNTIDLRADLARIKAPVLVLGAWAGYKAYGATKASVQQTYDLQYAQLPQKRIALSEAGKHFLMWDDPQWLVQEVDAFLQQHAPSKAKPAGRVKNS